LRAAVAHNANAADPGSPKDAGSDTWGSLWSAGSEADYPRAKVCAAEADDAGAVTTAAVGAGRPSRADNSGASRAALPKNSSSLARADVWTAGTNTSYALALSASAAAKHARAARADGVSETCHSGEFSSAEPSDSVGVTKTSATDHTGAPRAAGPKNSRSLVRNTWDLAPKTDAYHAAAAGT
jgi:hypothetical protein